MTLKLAVKRLTGRIASVYPRAPQRRIILLYHAVGNSPWAIPRATFARQLEMVAQMATIVDLATLLEADMPPCANRPRVAITFDDGYASLLEEAAPILQEFGATATVFLNTGYIGDEFRQPSDATLGHYPNETFLRWAEVEALISAGWGVGAHGVRHLDLSQASQKVAETEVAGSKAMIEERLGRPCEMFAYTWGRHSPALRDTVRHLGFRFAMTGEHGVLTQDRDPMRLPRINIASDYSTGDLAAIIRGDWDFLGLIQAIRMRHHAGT